MDAISKLSFKLSFHVLDMLARSLNQSFGRSIHPQPHSQLETSTPAGHLPLTSALRGTSLLKNLLTYPLWDDPNWQKWHDEL